jgi:hypothetical protein
MENFNDEINRLLDTFEQRKNLNDEAQKARRQREIKFLDEFSKFRTEIAQPLFAEVAETILSRGHDTKILIDNGINRIGSCNMDITFYLSLASDDRSTYPGNRGRLFTLFASKHYQNVRIHWNNGLAEGTNPEVYKIGQLTHNLLEERLMDFIVAAFRN